MALAGSMEACPEACRFRDDGLVACILLAVGAVVVYVLYVLIEANVEFPAVGQLVLSGADTSFDVELAYCWIVADDIDERIDGEVVEGSCGLALIEIVEVVAVDEAEVEIWYALAIASAYEWMVRAEVAYEAVAYADLKGVGFGQFFLAAMVGCDSEHLARDHAVESSDWIEECAYHLAEDSP